MTNMSQRKSYLNNLFNVKKLSNIFIQERPEWVNRVAGAIDDFKRDWGIIPSYSKNELDLPTLLKEKKYQWLKDVNITDYGKLVSSGTAPEDIVWNFYKEALANSVSVCDLNSEVPKKDITSKPLMSVDLETTGLDVTYFKIGGKTIHTCYITGICLAYMDDRLKEHAIYIPVLHTEADGIPNLSYKVAIELLTKIAKEFTPVYHNSLYDRDVSSLNGVVFDQLGGYFDTLNIVKQTDLKLRDFFREGLKEMSRDVLDREQITLSMIDAKSVGYHNLAYSEMDIYGVSDASNTIALFYYFLTNYPDVFTEGLTILQIDAKSMDVTWNLNRRGFPADKEYMYNSFKDVLRRELLLYSAFSEIMTELGCEEDIYITKTEAISRHLISVYIDNFTSFVKKKTNLSIDIWNDSEALQKFCTAVSADLGVEIKTKYLKSGEFKLTHSMDVNHLSHIFETVETIRWMEPDVAEKIVELCEILLSVSSILQNANSYYTPFIKGLTFDDYGYYKLPVALKFSGTVTTRFSNKSGKPSAIIIDRLKTKTNFKLKIGEGLSGVNAQGLPSAPYIRVTAKRIDDVPNSLGTKISNRLKALEADVEEYFNDKLL